MSTRALRQNWIQSDIELLKQNFDLEYEELLKIFPTRDIRGIQAKIVSLKLKRTDRNWPPEKIKLLQDNFGKISSKELSILLDKSEHTICEYSRRHGLKLKNFKDENGRTVNTKNKPTLLPLLSEELQSYYWIGYLMADGYMHERLGQIVLASTEIDKEHLDKYAEFLQTTAKVYKKTSGYSDKEGFQVRVSVADVLNCPKIKEKFDWKIQKTYYPPEVSKLEEVLKKKDKFLAFLIGFIDGDGYINPTYVIKLENHISWIKVHEFFLNNLIKWNILITKTLAKENERGYCQSAINTSATKKLKKFIVDSNLIVLNRKWNKVTL